MTQDTSFVFFGTDEFSVIVLEELKNAGYTPALVVTVPDRRQGRGRKLTPPPVKQRIMNYESPNTRAKLATGQAGIKNKIKVLQPEKLDTTFAKKLEHNSYDLFVVASYGKIIPKEILDIPRHGTLNVHPSLLPLFRGSSPIHSQILENTRMVGATIMLMDEEVDHGPILAAQELEFKIYDLRFKNLRDELAKLGGKLLAQTIPEWIQGNINPQEQDHKVATYTKQITKEDGLIDIEKESPEILYRKFRAYHTWPGIYFFQDGKRIKITDAELEDGKFIIKKVIPEGKQEMNYSDFRS